MTVLSSTIALTIAAVALILKNRTATEIAQIAANPSTGAAGPRLLPEQLQQCAAGRAKHGGD